MKAKMGKVIATTLGLGILGIIGSPSAGAQTLYNSNFDPLTPGAVVGQDSWVPLEGTSSLAVIVADPAVAYSGSNFLQITGTPGSDVSVRRMMPANALSDTQNNKIQFVFRANAIGSGVTSLYFGARGNEGGDTMVQLAIDNNGDRLYISTDGGTYNTTALLSSVLDAASWYSMDITLNPSTRQYDLTITDTSDSSVLLAGTYSFRDTAPEYSQFYFLSYGNNGLGGTNWQIDDLSVASVPEPSAFALFGLAGLVAIGRRKKRSPLRS